MASTGPRSRERGEKAHPLTNTTTSIGASTGPRSRERGEGGEGGNLCDLFIASTGPRSRERGEDRRQPEQRRGHGRFNGATLA